MNIRKPLISCLIGTAAITPCIAQKAVKFTSETGMSGIINKEAAFYTGMNIEMSRNQNYNDFYAGINVEPDKKISFLGLAINDYSWAKNFSSWIRETFIISNKEANSLLEAAPIRANTNAGKFNISLSPSYSLYNDFKDGKTNQGINTIFQTTYSLSNNDLLFLEAKYSSEPANNLFNTHFGKIKDNISYMISYMKHF